MPGHQVGRGSESRCIAAEGPSQQQGCKTEGLAGAANPACFAIVPAAGGFQGAAGGMLGNTAEAGRATEKQQWNEETDPGLTRLARPQGHGATHRCASRDPIKH